MHQSSLENMDACCKLYAPRLPDFGIRPLSVLDIGGANVNGSYSDIFCGDEFEYTAADLTLGPGIDLVLDDPYRIPVDDGQFDLVISGQAFEHVEEFWRLFAEMVRVTNDR
ncbi:MAG: methyltransferase domain-containing protein, partial [Pseudomonadota bacterium]